MNRRVPLAAGLLLSLLAGAALADPAGFRVLVTRPFGASGTVVVPDTFLRPWDPVTVFFPSETGRPGPEDDPGRFVRLSPDQPGAWSWIDARTLQFQPAEPWPALGRYSVTAGGRAVELATLLSPPLQTFPADGADGLDPVETLTFGFSDALDPDALAHMVRIELRPLPGLGGEAARWLGHEDFTVKEVDAPPTTVSEAVEGGGDTGHHVEVVETTVDATYALVLDQPIPAGTRAVVHFRLAAGDDAAKTTAQVSFSTAEPFRVSGAGCPGRSLPVTPSGTAYEEAQALQCSNGRALRVDFTARPHGLGPVEARNLVRVEPAVDDLTFELNGSRLDITGSFAPETAYRVVLAPTRLKDAAGRELQMTGESAYWAWFPRQAAYLRWGAADGLVERYGPQTVPVEGRASDRADLRVYKIDPLDRSFWPFPPSPVQVDESIRPPHPGEEPPPFEEPTGRIGADALVAQLRALGSPPVSKLIDLPLSPATDAARFGLDLSEHLAWISGKNAPGTYLVGLRALDASTTRSYLRVQVTDLSLTAVEETAAVRFLVTSLASGDPVSGAEVRLEGAEEVGGEWAWSTLATGKTDGDGAWRFAAPGDVGTSVLQRVVVRKADDTLVVDANRAPMAYEDGHWGNDSSDWLAWAWQTLRGREPAPETLCHLFSERPVYRPEEPVLLKGWLRSRAKGTLAPVTGLSGKLVVAGPGNQVWREDVVTSETGGFHHRFQQEKLATGPYRAWLEGPKGQKHCAASFLLDAYRIPSFEVTLSGTDPVPLDHEFEVKLGAGYFAGGRVADRPVRWRVTQYPLTWAPKAREGFLYSTDARWSGRARFDATPRFVKDGRTDEKGGATLVIDPTIEPDAQPRSYLVEATVTGEDDQTVTATRRVQALPPFVLGLKVPRYLERATVIEPEWLVAGPKGDLLAGQEVTVRLKSREWHSVLQASDFSSGKAKYLTDIVERTVAEKTMNSAATPTKLSFPVERAGVYVVEVESRDRLGRAQVVSVDLYVGGEQPVAWQKASAGVFEVTPDKAAYDPGQTAQLVLRSPFASGEALVIVEAPDGNRYSHVTVRNGTATVSVPVLGTHVPRLPVHVVLMRGRVPDTGPVGASTQDLGKPATVAATTWLTVNPVDNTVVVKVENPAKATPGQTIPLTLRLSKPDGKPLAGEVALWLVDAAVLSLGKEARLDPLPDFITRVVSRLVLRDTRNDAFGRLPFAEIPGGDGGEEEEAPLEKATVRKDFRAVPYWEPALKVGPDGKLTVLVKLPDNLTVFKIRAKAAAGPDRFGFATGEIAVRLPVLVQPALPRFVRPGDEFVATGVARVTEGDGGAGAAQIEAAGLALQGAAKQSVTLDAAKSVLVKWPVKVETPGWTADGKLARESVTVKMGVSRKGDGAADAFEVSLPIREDRGVEVLRQTFELAAGASATVPALPEAARPGTVRRTWLASDEPAIVRAAAALAWLADYPYGGIEARISTARAFLALGQLRGAAGLSDGKADLDRLVNQALAELPGAVTPNGLVAPWPGGSGRVSLTAWTLDFCVEAREAGYAVDEALVRTLIEALTRSLRSDAGWFIDGEAWVERTLALEALTYAGRFDSPYFAELSREAKFLDAEGVASVVVAATRGGQTGAPATRKLVDLLAGGIVTRLWQGKEIYGGLQTQRTPRNPLILPSETRTVASITRALARAKPDHPRLPILLDALARLAREDGWGSTNANAEAALALADRLKNPPPGKTWGVRVEQAGAFDLGPQKPTAMGREALAATVKATSGGPLLVRVETRYLPEKDGSAVAPDSRGYVVSRTVSKVLDKGPMERHAVEQAGTKLTWKLGDVVEDSVRVTVPEDRWLVAITLPLPAGLEALNPALATAPPEATPSAGPSLTPSWARYQDDQVTWVYEKLPKGTYELRVRARATVAGSYVMPAASATNLYDLSVTGHGAGARVVVEP